VSDMRDVTVSGVGMSTFGRHIGRTVKSLVAEATREALSDAGRPSVQMVYYANAAGGLLQGQESVRGQHAVRGTGLEGVPLVNVENACASGSTALHQAWLAVASGHVDVALAVGAEKLSVNNRSRAFAAMAGALDQDRLYDVYAELGTVRPGSVFMDIYARFAAWYLGRTRASVEDFAAVSVKNHEHGLANPKAQYGGRLTVAEVLAARPVSGPLTVPMCAPMSDGAAAVVVTTPQIATRQGADPVRLLATAVGAARPGEYGVVVPATARRAYESAGVGPSDVDVVECHDAAASAELIIMEELGLCEQGESPALLRAGETRLGGRLPVNPSGGLQSRGHPLGATGLAQVVELAEQLRGRAGERQVLGARLALAENAGGYVGPDVAVATVTILGR
jgi:acetyl-CoA acetyltransferase